MGNAFFGQNDAVTNRFKEERDINTKKSIVTFLWFANTCYGNEFIKAIATDKALDKEIVAYTNDLLTRRVKKRKILQRVGQHGV